jgi:hypothetical protein
MGADARSDHETRPRTVSSASGALLAEEFMVRYTPRATTVLLFLLAFDPLVVPHQRLLSQLLGVGLFRSGQRPRRRHRASGREGHAGASYAERVTGADRLFRIAGQVAVMTIDHGD